jgi:transposase
MARPITQTDLYRTITGDRETHHRTIGAELDKQLPTHRRVIALYAQGLSDRQVGERTNRHHGAARGMLRRAMFAVYKRIHRLPRYHIKGREHGYQLSKTQRTTAPREIQATAAIIAEQAPSFRDFLTPAERAQV